MTELTNMTEQTNTIKDNTMTDVTPAAVPVETRRVINLDDMGDVFLPVEPGEYVNEVCAFIENGILHYYWLDYANECILQEDFTELHGITEPWPDRILDETDYDFLALEYGKEYVFAMYRGRVVYPEDARRAIETGAADKLFVIDCLDYLHGDGVKTHLDIFGREYPAWAEGDVYEVKAVAVDMESWDYDIIGSGYYYGLESVDGWETWGRDLATDAASFLPVKEMAK